jgi:hypothetical protein
MRQFVAVALGHAPGDDQLGAILARVAEGKDGVDRFLARRFDEGAGVDDDDVGLIGGARRREPVGQQRSDQLVGIDLVLRAAEGLHPKSARHGGEGYRSPSRCLEPVKVD